MLRMHHIPLLGGGPFLPYRKVEAETLDSERLDNGQSFPNSLNQCDLKKEKQKKSFPISLVLNIVKVK